MRRFRLFCLMARGTEKDTGRSESGGDTGGAEDEVQAMY